MAWRESCLEMWRQAQLLLCAFTAKHFKSLKFQRPCRGCGEKGRRTEILLFPKWEKSGWRERILLSLAHVSPILDFD